MPTAKWVHRFASGTRTANISANELKVQTFNRFRAFRDQMLNIPDRVAGELAGISDAHEIFRILRRREAAKKMGTSER
jgi:hypothetical protein